MKMIPLTQGKFAKVDDDWYDYLNQWKWFAKKDKGTWYAVSSQGRVFMHRIISGADKGMMVDHVDSDGLNNTVANLRVCTLAENNRNKRLYKNNTTGYKGVYKEDRKYVARIKFNKKLFRLGWFDTAEEAARAYDKAARKNFGEFARLNFPD